VILLLVTGIGLLASALYHNSKLNSFKELRDELSFENMQNLSREEREEKFRALRDASEELTPEQRKELEKEREREQEEKVKPYFALETQDERTAYLDQQIEKEEAVRKNMQGRFAFGPGGPPVGEAGQGGMNRGGPGQGGPGGRQVGAQGSPNPNAAPGGAENPGGPGGPRATARPGGPWGGTAEERELRRKERLDHTTAEGRAMVAAFRRDMAARRQALGFGPGGPGGPAGPPPGGLR
jgi:hypothetical protein